MLVYFSTAVLLLRFFLYCHLELNEKVQHALDIFICELQQELGGVLSCDTVILIYSGEILLIHKKILLSSLFIIGNQLEWVRMYIAVTLKRYRAVKEVGKIKMSVSVIAYYQLVQVCQAEYFRQLLKPVTQYANTEIWGIGIWKSLPSGCFCA